MPELPEVETVRRILEPQLAGRTVVAVQINKPVIAHPAEKIFRGALVGKTFADTARRGKFLIMNFTDGSRLVVHLRMTGCLLVTPPDYPAEPHTHVTIALTGGGELRFVDARRFGRMWLICKDEEDIYSGAGKLGLEPADAALTADVLKNAFGKRGLPLKTALLDQTVVAGIGNIYSDEICFAAGLRPDRAAKTLTDAEWEAVCEKIRAVIGDTVEVMNEVSADEYLRGKGHDYRRKPTFLVYGREGKPCVVCGATLVGKAIGGRSSCFCERCQK